MESFTYKTAEAVSPAHPDKLCDQISDLILTRVLEQDPNSRVAIETMGGHGKIFITGQLSTTADIDYQSCVDQVLIENRYNPSDYILTTNVVLQSPQIAQGVDTGGAGDQGIMVGYAVNTPETNYLPRELYESRKILKDLWNISESTRDAKAQVTTHNNNIETIVVSAERIGDNIIKEYLEERYGKSVRFFINPAGTWSNGGFEADAGLTGRKLAVDNYGPEVEIGGGAFSGKDYTKVDRSAAYIARKICVDALRESGDKYAYAKAKIAYSIGVAEPVMAVLDLGGEKQVVLDPATLTPQAICDTLNLRQQDYYQTAKWGHFGEGFLWG